MDDQQPTNHRPLLIVALGCGLLIAVLLLYFYLVRPPADFPLGIVVSIIPGESLSQISNDFKEKNIVRSRTAFQSLAILFGGEHNSIAGDYLLDRVENAVTLARRVSRGAFDMVEIKVTIPEGFSVSDIGDTLEKKLVEFNKYRFVTDAKKYEGYLFPDTYFFPPTATSSQVILRMKQNFDAKITTFQSAILASKHTQAEVVTMASILEGEATSTHDRQIVAGILWNRIRQKLPLQVDSTLKYITGKASADLTVTDLQIDSPYNTYLYRGLPPTPINNPGSDSIFASLNPIITKYVYFLTGRDGVMHYATTLAEHDRNIEKYLR